MLDIFVHDMQTGQTRRVSVSSTGEQGNYFSYDPVISANGRYIAFWSYATNLVIGDTNQKWDVFVYDLETSQIRRISVSSTGEQGNGTSLMPTISSDGRFVAFFSEATNLTGADANGSMEDIYVHDLMTGQTERVSVSSTAEQGNNASGDGTISADGRYVAFASSATNLVNDDTNGLDDAFIFDRQTRQTIRVSVSSTGEQANGRSFFFPVMSADNRYVVFFSEASNLVGGDTNGKSDIFIHDRCPTGTCAP